MSLNVNLATAAAAAAALLGTVLAGDILYRICGTLDCDVKG